MKVRNSFPHKPKLPYPFPYPSPGKANPKVFFDMTVCGKPVGRIVMELFADTTHGRQRISAPSVQARKAWGKKTKGKDAEANQSTAVGFSRMRTSSKSTPVRVSSP
ncbi:unnamed protein product [Brassica oleracea]